MELTVTQGNIATQRADALVTAAGTSLMMDTGGTGTALLAVGGEAIGKAAVERGPIALGEVAVTDAYGLDAEYVIHAAAAPFGGDARAETIRRAVRNTLETADELGCHDVVMPAIGCGGAGFDIDAGGELICTEVDAFDPETLADVTLIGYTDAEYAALQHVAARF